MAREVVGGRVAGVDRLRGGSKKGVYRVRFVDGPGVIVYRWADEEDFWPEATGSGVFAHASGAGLFLAARGVLAEVGVRVPRLLAAEGDLAVVEDVSGGTLESLFAADPARARVVVGDLARHLGLMRAHRSPGYGRVGQAVVTEPSCAEVVLERALGDLDEAARRDGRVERAYAGLRELLIELRGRVVPRAEFGLVHGELGPDHVLVDGDGRAVLIDIEGLMFFDVEWEHVFLRLRFGAFYEGLATAGLDPVRSDFYDLAMRMSLVAGPLRLLDGKFPEREFMVKVVENNLRAALERLAS